MNEIEQLLQLLMSDPNMRKRAELMAKNTSPEYVDLLNKVKSGTGILQAGVGMGVGLSQKKMADKALKQLQKPAIPGRQNVDPSLLRVLQQFESIAASPERQGALGAYNQEVAKAYDTGMANARTASGGQAGSMASQAQALYNQRLNQAGQIPGMMAQIQNQALTGAGEMAGRKAQADSFAYMNNMNRTKMQLDQYNTESDAAANLYNTGAQNFFNSMNYGLSSLQNPLSDILYSLKNKTGVAEFDQQRESIDKSMNSLFAPTKPTGNQMYGAMTPMWNQESFNQPVGDIRGQYYNPPYNQPTTPTANQQFIPPAPMGNGLPGVTNPNQYRRPF